MKDLAIVLLNYNGSKDTIECIRSLDMCKTKYKYDVYIMDNGSIKDELKTLEEYLSNRIDFKVCTYDEFNEKKLRGNILILSEENAGFARGNNRVILAAYKEYSYVLLLNNDTVVRSDFIEKMLDLMNDNHEIGFASCRIDNYYQPGLLWNCGGVLKLWGVRKYYSEHELEQMPEIISAEFITGCALFIRSTVIDEYGVLSDRFFHGEEDFNFCWKMKKNHVKGKCINEALVYHKVSATSKKGGVQPGKMAGYYAYRIVDMKQFYTWIVWYMWKTALIQVLKIRWKRTGYLKEDIRKMVDILKRTSQKESLNREDTLKIWDLTY